MADNPESATPPGPDEAAATEHDEGAGVLDALLAELEWEREQRREAETRLRAREAEDRSTRDNMILYRTQRDAFLRMVETLTETNEAVAFASAFPSESLPLHEVHLLEIMPWDEEVQEDVAKKVDELYEWQTFDTKRNTWSSILKEFPDDFRSLPVEKPVVDSTKDGRRRHEPAPKALVLTNDACTQVLNVEDGYPLPTRGTWKWIGGWKVELQYADGTPCDEEGWTYARQPKLFLSNNTSVSSGSIGHRFRRRRWTRLRTLVGYPSASEKTECCLHLMAKNASLELSTLKLSDQLLHMQEALSQSQDANWDLQLKMDKQTADLKLAEERVQGLEPTAIGDHACPSEPVDAEPKSLALWHTIVAAKNAISDSGDRTTEPSTSDDGSVRSQETNLDSDLSVSVGGDGHGAPGAHHWKMIGEGGGALLDRIVNNMPIKAKSPVELKEMLEMTEGPNSAEEFLPKPTALQQKLFGGQPTLRF